MMKVIDNILNTVQLYLYKFDINMLGNLGNKIQDFRIKHTIKYLIKKDDNKKYDEAVQLENGIVMNFEGEKVVELDICKTMIQYETYKNNNGICVDLCPWCPYLKAK